MQTIGLHVGRVHKVIKNNTNLKICNWKSKSADSIVVSLFCLKW